MKQLNAAMGGEFSGHIVMRDRWSDFDDGPYVAARLLEVIANSDLSPEEIYSQIPDSYSTREFKLNFDHPDLALDVLGKFIRRADFSGADLSLIDGLRVDYDDGWGLIRSSNTVACLTFRFEAVSLERLGELQDQFRFVFDRLNEERIENNQKPLLLPF
jgi:phosphomannomutase/phosphoglucomutase